MKRILFLILALSAFNVYSQDKPFKIGPRFGAGAGWFGIKEETSNTGYYNNGPSAGCFSVGISSEIKLSKRFFLKPEVFYLKGKANQSYSNVTTDASGYEARRNYLFPDATIKQIQVPVLLRFNIKKVYLLAGPSYSYLFKNKDNYTYIPNNTADPYVYYGSDFGLNTGFGVEITKKPYINLELRHYRGFKKLDSVGYHYSYAQVGIAVMLE